MLSHELVHAFWKVLWHDASRTSEHSPPTVPPRNGSLGTGRSRADPCLSAVTLLLAVKVGKSHQRVSLVALLMGMGHLAPGIMFAYPESGRKDGAKEKLCRNVCDDPSLFSSKIHGWLFPNLYLCTFRAEHSRRSYPRVLILVSSFLTSGYIFVLKIALLKYNLQTYTSTISSLSSVALGELYRPP